MSPSSSELRGALVAGTLALAFVSTCSIVEVAHAEPTPAEIDTARRLYKEALELRKSGGEASALVKLKAAYALSKSAVLGLEVAKSEAALGKLIEAREQAIEIESLPVVAKETKVSADAREEATRLAAAIEQRIASVNVRLTGVPSGSTPNVTIDGVPLPSAALGLGHAIDPGKHAITASAGNGPIASVEIVLGEGESRDVTLSLATTDRPPAAPTPDKHVDQPAPPTPDTANGGIRFELGARLGYGLPMGSADASTTLGDALGGLAPFGVDGALVLPAGWSFGGYLAYGIASVKRGGPFCPSVASSCSGHDIRVGVEVLYHFSVGGPGADPWIGFGAGYEWLAYDLSAPTNTGGNATGTESVKGIELLNLQAGCSWRLAPTLGLGPFLQLSLGKYTDYSYSITSNGVAQPEKSGSIDAPKMHEWLQLGVRGALRL